MANTQPMLPEPFLRTIFRDPLPFLFPAQSNSPFPPVISAQARCPLWSVENCPSDLPSTPGMFYGCPGEKGKLL